MFELKRVESKYFDEIYEGTNGNKKVICILDDYCVRYHVIIGRKNVRHEFSNDKKELCFKNATKALNK